MIPNQCSEISRPMVHDATPFAEMFREVLNGRKYLLRFPKLSSEVDPKRWRLSCVHSVPSFALMSSHTPNTAGPTSGALRLAPEHLI